MTLSSPTHPIPTHAPVAPWWPTRVGAHPPSTSNQNTTDYLPYGTTSPTAALRAPPPAANRKLDSTLALLSCHHSALVGTIAAAFTNLPSPDHAANNAEIAHLRAALQDRESTTTELRLDKRGLEGNVAEPENELKAKAKTIDEKDTKIGGLVEQLEEVKEQERKRPDVLTQLREAAEEVRVVRAALMEREARVIEVVRRGRGSGRCGRRRWRVSKKEKKELLGLLEGMEGVVDEAVRVEGKLKGRVWELEREVGGLKEKEKETIGMVEDLEKDVGRLKGEVEEGRMVKEALAYLVEVGKKVSGSGDSEELKELRNFRAEVVYLAGTL